MKTITKHHVVYAQNLKLLGKEMDKISEEYNIIASNVFAPALRHQSWSAILFEKLTVRESR